MLFLFFILSCTPFLPIHRCVTTYPSFQNLSSTSIQELFKITSNLSEQAYSTVSSSDCPLLSNDRHYTRVIMARKVRLQDDSERGKFLDDSAVGIVQFDGTKRTIWVSFSGTRSFFPDMALNLIYSRVNTSFFPTVPLFLEAHQGFLHLAKISYKSLQASVLEYFASSNDEDILDYEIFFTGHSRGGALAILTALMMNSDPQLAFAEGNNDFSSQSFNIHNNIKVITLGAPRVLATGSSFSIRHENHLRIYSPFDIVPRVPSSWMGYKHTGLGFAILPAVWSDILHVMNRNPVEFILNYAVIVSMIFLNPVASVPFAAALCAVHFHSSKRHELDFHRGGMVL